MAISKLSPEEFRNIVERALKDPDVVVALTSAIMKEFGALVDEKSAAKINQVLDERADRKKD